MTDVKDDGSFGFCLPDGDYALELRDPMLSFPYPVELAETASTKTSRSRACSTVS